MPDFSSALALLTSPAILFFFIGAAAALARSDLTIPEPVAKALSSQRGSSVLRAAP